MDPTEPHVRREASVRNSFQGLGRHHSHQLLWFSTFSSRVHQSLTTWRTLHADMKDFEDWLTGAESSLTDLQSEGHNRAERKEKLKELESQVTARHK